MFTSAVLFRRRAADMMIGRLRLRSSSVSYRIFATHVARSFAEPRRAASRLFGRCMISLFAGRLSVAVSRACCAHGYNPTRHTARQSL